MKTNRRKYRSECGSDFEWIASWSKRDRARFFALTDDDQNAYLETAKGAEERGCRVAVPEFPPHPRTDKTPGFRQYVVERRLEREAASKATAAIDSQIAECERQLASLKAQRAQL